MNIYACINVHIHTDIFYINEYIYIYIYRILSRVNR